jgi:uncharacterized repeat protein (TIGR03803 family)
MSRIQLTTGACVLSLGLALAVTAAPAQAKGYKQLYAFQGGTTDGSEPAGALLSYQGGFYGSTGVGGADGAGTIFKIARNGTAEMPLYSFKGGSDGSDPTGPLVADKSGNFYGVAYEGGGGDCSGTAVSGCGTVFEFTPDNKGRGTLTLLHTFQGGSDGANPNYGVIIDEKGNLYGTTGLGGGGSCQFTGGPPGCGTVFEVASDGTETVLYAFQGGTRDGALPFGDLLEDSRGNLYGTTFEGGVTTCVSFGVRGCGTVFELSPRKGGKWKEKVLYSFCSQANCSDGAWPVFEPLIMDSSGNLYGTTISGGANPSCGAQGCGTVFKLAPNGAESVLYNFCSNGYPACTDGYGPSGSLIFDSDGNLYSTTQQGGGGEACEGGCGTVFKLTPDGEQSVLHSFKGGSDGAEPLFGLIADKLGNLYSTTYEGGSANCSGGCGTIFKVKE